MYIEEITIEGFKSYATRVNIPNFDRYFNAITGLNGTGKSNILDSICFVLGITNLSQVRASNLQELVYKQGQAGITKATVSIVFNNADKANSPVGYEHFEKITVTRQLVIGGRNKYLINGHVAQPGRVQNLFHSVQLNVNNPHFLIMQGRITKVLNMKPPEILGMLEEAAGTRMYENKKETALKTLEKKQVKVDEIDKVLAEDILPALERLKRERGEYMEWQAANAKLDRLRRFCVAFQYVEAKRLQQQGDEEVKSVQSRIDELGQQAASLEEDLKDKDEEIRSLQTELELQSGGEVKELTQTVDSLAKQLVKETTAWTNKKESVTWEENNTKQLRANMEELGVEVLAARLATATADRDAAAADVEKSSTAVEAATRELAGAEAGDGRDESNRSMQERLADAQTAQTAAEGEAKQADMRAKHLKKQLAEQQKGLASKKKEAEDLERKLQAQQRQVNDCRQRLEQVDFDESAAVQLEETIKQEQAEVQRCKRRVDELSSKVAGVNFRYSSPDPGFQKEKVKGVVAKLVRLKDETTTTALEVVAGGKLYQVVVDTEQTAKALLARGQLRNRVTIIPLNKVNSRAASNAVQAAAKTISKGKASLALELVGFDKELSAAMNYVFGNAFVCQDSGTAKALAFNKDVRTRCITLEGDDFNPAGTLTGGSRNTGSSVLAQLHALADAEAELAGHEEALNSALAAQAQMGAASVQYRKLKQDLELKQHALSLLEERISCSESATLSAAAAETQAELEKAIQDAAQARERQADLASKAKDLKKEISEFTSKKDSYIKAAQKKLAAAKASLEAAKKVLKAKASALSEAVAEGEAAAVERTSLAAQLEAAEKTVEGLKQEASQLEATVARTKAEYDTASARLDTLKSRLRECNAQIAAIGKAKEGLSQRLSDLAVERKKLEHKVGRMQKDMQAADEQCEKMEKQHSWISSERQFFGRPGSDYDWASTDVDAAFAEHHQLEDAQQKRTKKGINQTVMQMFEKAESDYRALSEKKRIIENDKAKIHKVIAELDEKKREALEKTWLKVNADFGSIFSTLLPGTEAKLEPPEGASFLDGLEVRVAFGGVWKESLTELSGGQRSLLALSLILAMLLFKPAPIYILDEVDAALDLSHTQNIGRMIKSHFPYSQFIVVSLKEGMFNNANVIFRTKFVEGVSAVTRTVPSHNQENERAPKGKGRSSQPTRPVLVENVRN
eukprot:jgi/Botrbrau1/3583/Bobra.0078s0035.1